MCCTWWLYGPSSSMLAGLSISCRVLFAHIATIHYNAPNQWSWVQYHCAHDLMLPSDMSCTLLIHPSDKLACFHATRASCPSVNQSPWPTINIPPWAIQFTTINGCCLHDCITKALWSRLSDFYGSYNNAPLKLDIPTFSIHVDHGVLLSITLTHMLHSSMLELHFLRPEMLHTIDKRSLFYTPVRFFFFYAVTPRSDSLFFSCHVMQ